MNDIEFGERKKKFLIEDFQPVTVESHPYGMLLTDADGTQILRTHPRRILINGKYHRVPAQDYLVSKEPAKRTKDVRVTG